MSEQVAGFLIDEDLSYELAEIAVARGYHALAVTRMRGLRGRGDQRIAKYAIDHDLILVTNNLVDFERIYDNRDYHPGLIAICSSDPKLRKLQYQRKMMEKAIDEVESKEPIQELIYLFADGPLKGPVTLTIDRWYLPQLSEASLGTELA